jgi:dTDP-3-amino-3,4,6-trideoxy-alpha-D-glucose transaminase
MSIATQPSPALSLSATDGNRVPFIKLDAAQPELLEELLEVVGRVARDGAFTLGPEVEDFERSFAAYCETDHCVGVSSGTMALELALRGLEIGPGDEVIVPTYTFFASAEAVSTVGATPVLVDIDPDTAVITAENVERALTPRTRAVIPVHLFGRTVEMDPILDLCREHGIAVIEDACQAHGARYRGRRVGSLGDAGCFSFYPTKNLGGWGDGGAMVTNDPQLAEKVGLLRSHGESPRHNHQLITGTHRLDALQAAILEVKLRHLDEWNEKRRAAGNALSSALADSGLTLPAPTSADADNVFHLYVVRSEEREALRDHLDACGIASAVHYPTPIHLQPAYAELGLGPGDLPVAERLARECCSLPLFPAIEDSQIAETVAAIESFGTASYS